MWHDPRVWVGITAAHGEVWSSSDADLADADLPSLLAERPGPAARFGGGPAVDAVLGSLQRLRETTQSFEQQWLPVFVRADDDEGRRLVEHLLVSVPPGDIEVVQLTPLAARRGEFTLPLRVAAVGGHAGSLVDDLTARQNPWLGQDHRTPPSRRSAGVPDEADPPDLLVVDPYSWQEVDPAVAARTGLVVLGRFDDDEGSDAPVDTRGAPAVVEVRGDYGSVVELVDALLWALSHDRPLHDAVHDARNLVAYRGLAPTAGIRLAANPESVHALRLTSAWSELERRYREVSSAFGALARTQPFSEPFTEAYGGLYVGRHISDPWWERAMVASAPVAESDVSWITFERESRGLFPLEDLRRRLERAEEFIHDASRDPTYQDLLDEVDVEAAPVRLLEVGVREVGGAGGAPASPAYLAPTAVLRPHTPYDVDVQIGPAWEQSIVTGERPPIDPLLPDDREGHELQVHVLSDAVDVPEPTTTLWLPPTGASRIATLRIVTRSLGPTWFRVLVHHRNNLVQTVLVTAEVSRELPRVPQYGEPAVDPSAPARLVATVDHVNTHRWTNLDDLPERDVSLALNDAGGAHRLYVTSEGLAETVELTDTALAEGANAVREALAAIIDAPAEAAALLPRLARAGHTLYFALLQRLDPAAQRKLDTLLDGQERTIQVVRVDVQQALPWSAVYDWPLSEEIAGVDDPPGCLGTVDGHPCAHDGSTEEVCLRGFWSIRHLVEEILGDTETRDRVLQVPVSTTGTLVAAGVTDPALATLTRRIEALFTAGPHDRPDATTRLMDRLFAANHAGLVVLLGPSYGRDVVIQGQPRSQRIELTVAERWLTQSAVLQAYRRNARPWDASGPLVVLLSCSTLATSPRDLTSILGALHASSAGALVGAEVDLHADLAADFTARLLEAMRPADGSAGLTLAQAVRATRLAYAQQGDLRGMVFDAFGPADLVLA
ncbi:hypothetical protein [Cellulomonas massiliensis]|uniref:hypothetical protein n=1 Tax=Cellulomonas massiliensis TaxID=1465811 RepID=UPI00037126C1|nr:hypothetical protein [Cellulomonas massiliensis]